MIGIMAISGLGERLHKIRENRHLSQSEVARAIGVSPSIVSNYERSERMPALDKLLALASLFQCSTDYLLGIESKEMHTMDISMLSESQRILLQNFLCSLKTE